MEIVILRRRKDLNESVMLRQSKGVKGRVLEASFQLMVGYSIAEE